MTLLLLINILLGLAVLLFGRKLFWLFVAVAGFAFGFSFADTFLAVEPIWLSLLIGLGIGLIGAIVAIFVQQAAVAIAGFLFGAYILSRLVDIAGLETAEFAWVVLLVGDILGLILILALFDPALIFISAVGGAVLVSNSVTEIFDNPGLNLLIFIVLAAIGLAFQISEYRRERRIETGTS